jgi:hypothetical protein
VLQLQRAGGCILYVCMVSPRHLFLVCGDHGGIVLWVPKRGGIATYRRLVGCQSRPGGFGYPVVLNQWHEGANRVLADIAQLAQYSFYLRKHPARLL